MPAPLSLLEELARIPRAVQCFKLGKGTCHKFNSDGRQALSHFPYLETLNCPGPSSTPVFLWI
jgi:hypothetical protein